MDPEIIALIEKYIGGSLKSVESCIDQYPDTVPKYKPIMKVRGELKQILKACKEETAKWEEVVSRLAIDLEESLKDDPEWEKTEDAKWRPSKPHGA